MTPRAIVITGASGGLGQALVKAYAGAGRALLLFGRDSARLEQAREAARAAGSEAVAVAADISDHDLFEASLKAFAERFGLDLVILNAGVKTGNTGGVEAPGQTERVVAVNLLAPIRQAETSVALMRAHGGGRVALVSSLAALSLQPDLISYGASKAGLSAYGTALRRALRGSGIGISVVAPGFIATPMTERHDGPVPFLMDAETAALRIRDGLSRGRNTILFPRRLALLIRLMAMLPMPLADAIANRFAATIHPDDDERPGQPPP